MPAVGFLLGGSGDGGLVQCGCGATHIATLDTPSSLSLLLLMLVLPRRTFPASKHSTELPHCSFVGS